MDHVISIHHRAGSFSDRWVSYCSERNIKFKLINCLRNDAIQQIRDTKYLLWHWAQHSTAEILVAKAVIKSAELMGTSVYPSSATCWHFDDKVSQKYLLESVGAPLVPTFVFYQKDEALDWVNKAKYPIVFKLSKGAGSVNVKLVNSAHEARALVKTAFGKGFKQFGGYFADAGKKMNQVKKRRDYLGVIKRLPQAYWDARKQVSQHVLERNYIYFQEFIPENKFDTRITIIGERAFGFTRDVRKNDFRASGSGMISYNLERVNNQCIKIAFEIAQRIGSQSLAFDFVEDCSGHPRIVEISYGFNAEAVRNCLGHWDRKMKWHEGQLWPQDLILDDLLNPSVVGR